jgi:hypothetical protein
MEFAMEFAMGFTGRKLRKRPPFEVDQGCSIAT